MSSATVLGPTVYCGPVKYTVSCACASHSFFIPKSLIREHDIKSELPVCMNESVMLPSRVGQLFQ